MARPDNADGARCGRRAVDDRLFAGVPVGFAGERCRGERRRDDRRPDGDQRAAVVAEDLLLPYAGGYHVVHRAGVRGLLRGSLPHDEEPPLRHLLEDRDGDRAAVRGVHDDHGRLVDEVRMGRVVDVGSAPDDVPHPHAHHHRVLHPAQRHRRRPSVARRTGRCSASSPSSTCRSALW